MDIVLVTTLPCQNISIWFLPHLFNSLKSIWPFPSMSYILKAHVNFSSAVPELLRGLRDSHQLWENYLVTWRANMNSLKSIVPLRSVSNVLKMISLNLSAQPPGNILLYISTNWALVSSPSGQSSIKPTCHSWGKITQSILNCPPELSSSKISKFSEREIPGQTRPIDSAVMERREQWMVDPMHLPKLIFLMSSHRGFAVCDLKLTFSSVRTDQCFSCGWRWRLNQLTIISSLLWLVFFRRNCRSSWDIFPLLVLCPMMFVKVIWKENTWHQYMRMSVRIQHPSSSILHSLAFCSPPR